MRLLFLVLGIDLLVSIIISILMDYQVTITIKSKAHIIFSSYWFNVNENFTLSENLFKVAKPVLSYKLEKIKRKKNRYPIFINPGSWSKSLKLF